MKDTNKRAHRKIKIFRNSQRSLSIIRVLMYISTQLDWFYIHIHFSDWQIAWWVSKILNYFSVHSFICIFHLCLQSFQKSLCCLLVRTGLFLSLFSCYQYSCTFSPPCGLSICSVCYKNDLTWYLYVISVKKIVLN